MFNRFHLNGMQAFEQNMYLDAKNLFLQAITENPEVPESYRYLADACFLNDEPQAAIPYLMKYIDLVKGDPKEIKALSYAYDLLGQCYAAGDHNRQAMECYTTAREIHSSSASAWHNMGLLNIKLARQELELNLGLCLQLFEEAKYCLEVALRISHTMPMFLNSMAGWYKEYIDVLEQLADNGDDVEKNIAESFNAAIKYYQDALNHCINNDTGLQNIIKENLCVCLTQYGDFLYQKNDLVMALKVYLQAYELNPYKGCLLNQLGMTYFKQNQFSQARPYFFKIFYQTFDPQELADAWLNIACTYRMEEAWAAAEEALIEAKKLAPDDPYILAEEANLNNARLQINITAVPQCLFNDSKVSEHLVEQSDKPKQASAELSAIGFFGKYALPEDVTDEEILSAMLNK